MSRPIAYICAPYAETEFFTVDENIARAVMLARIAVADGYAPILVHTSGQSVFGHLEDPRATAMDVDLAIVRAVAALPGSRIYVLTIPYGGMSSGCKEEVDEWETSLGSEPYMVSGASMGRDEDYYEEWEDYDVIDVIDAVQAIADGDDSLGHPSMGIIAEAWRADRAAQTGYVELFRRKLCDAREAVSTLAKMLGVDT